ncbi:hypothetical protein NEHOM01_0632 [Nematocida homosporus]|uniref:uncharacterized protein n=1 Tax=Nematocida homosporus TaxID=1912981 RepID=UPI002221097B|nr:uncharacterized protein NEHOM01_0632 [Nematocida homosporus]KAI5185127.1 hypothetical protein NEHOM01_0632 [Nematocida homosporus]
MESMKRLFRRVIRRMVVIRLGLMVVCLVVGSEVDEGDLERRAENWSNAYEMTEQMKKLGFCFTLRKRSFYPIPYKPSRIVETSFNQATLLNTPQYEMNYVGWCMRYTLPNYKTMDQASADLEELRKISLIRVECVLVNYEIVDSVCHRLNLQILSRVINMFDCATLVVYLRSTLVGYLSIDRSVLDMCWIEAANTVAHANYMFDCQLEFGAASDCNLLSIIGYYLPLLRPISSLRLQSQQIHHLSLVRGLVLNKDYTFTLAFLPDETEIDLGVLQELVPFCQKINLQGSIESNTTLFGLENAVDRHPRMILAGNWEIFLYLGRYNKSTIRVHTLCGLDVTLDSISYMLNATEHHKPAMARIIASKAHTMVATNMPCIPLDSYGEMYNAATYARYGISVDEVCLRYKRGRNDLYETLLTLFRLGALLCVPREIVENRVVCWGEELSAPDWGLEEPVIIRLHPIRNEWVLSDYQDKYMCFCQNICYTIIKIVGMGATYKGQTTRCIEILELFQNITAHEVNISNVQNDQPGDSTFEPLTLKARRAEEYTKLQMNIGFLVLDNVNMRVIYHIFAGYNFTKLVEVHILNMRFDNLAITQLLASPEGQMIKVLLINDFLELNEVVHYQQQEKFDGFSLFRHVHEELRDHESIQNLGLDRLVMQLGNINFRLYSKVLTKLTNYGIKLLAIPLAEYIINPPDYLRTDIMAGKKELVLYRATLSTLKVDFLTCYYITRSLFNPNQFDQDLESSTTRHSVQKLVLRFCGNQFLSEADLATIIRWVDCRFKSVITLWITNIMVSESTRKTLTSARYLITWLNSLESIHIEEARPNNTNGDIVIYPDRTILLANAPNKESHFVMLSATMLLRFATQPKHLAELISTQASPNPTLQMIQKYLTNNPTEILCPICHEALYIPKKRPAWCRFLCTLASKFTSNNSITMLCFFKCGHLVCSVCIGPLQPSNSCPSCRQEKVYANYHRLIRLPKSKFVFVKASATIPSIKSNNLASKSGYVYLYLSYDSLSDLCLNINIDTAAITSRPIHII